MQHTANQQPSDHLGHLRFYRSEKVKRLLRRGFLCHQQHVQVRMCACVAVMILTLHFVHILLRSHGV